MPLEDSNSAAEAAAAMPSHLWCSGLDPVKVLAARCPPQCASGADLVHDCVGGYHPTP
jgi:hypothetical protein